MNDFEIPKRPAGVQYSGYVLTRRVEGVCEVFIPEFAIVVGPGEYCYLPQEEADARTDFEVVKYQ